MVLAVVIGIVVGLLSCAPYKLGLSRQRTISAKSNLGYMGWFFISVLLSFVILLVSILVCVVVAREFLLPFAIAAIAVMVIGVVVVSIILPRFKQ